MRGAGKAGGTVIGVLSDSLERAAISRENRNLLREGKAVLVTPYDPAAGFNVGHAMRRNKLIYALADAALVVTAEFEKGGTWAGAVEQLEKPRLVPVFVYVTDRRGRAIEALRQKGAQVWPNPDTPEALVRFLSASDQATLPRPAQANLAL
jgi:predicted Rossmann fold nucleotide-binding protein DprA/Smf involved in DNA uptake